MDVTFRQLELYLALVDLQSVTAVARAFHVTQPTVSMQLRELTQSVGLPLYEVIGKRLFFTEAGDELARTARAMTQLWTDMGQRMDAFKGLTRGRLKVSVVSTAKYFVPRLLGRFCATHPDVDIALEVQNRDGVVQRLRDNRDDLYIMSMPPTDVDITRNVFLPNPLVVVAPIAHPLAESRGIALDILQAEKFILREKGSGTRRACDAYFAQQGFAPVVRLELGSNEAIKQAVAGGLGVSVLSTHALGDHVSDDSLCVLNVSGFPIHSNWYIVYPKGKRLPPIAQAFLDYLLQGIHTPP